MEFEGCEMGLRLSGELDRLWQRVVLEEVRKAAPRRIRVPCATSTMIRSPHELVELIGRHLCQRQAPFVLGVVDGFAVNPNLPKGCKLGF